tara:strand:- start:108527 stop:111982 length:3456 start_codon:yes stop_codon:yes gene_type:complete
MAKKQASKQLLHVQLDDKYTANEGTAFITGTQALVRLPLMRRQADVANNLNTAGFISGYRGSPLARLDQQLWAANNLLKENHITFTSGINEELGATAVWGSQMSNLYEGAKYDGVFGMWYGKGPGVDRALDCFKHAHANGTSKNGGYLVIVGDDHACVSSTLGHQSEQALASADIPTLYPSNIQEYLDYGMMGWDMSRYTGGIVAMKCVSEIVESSASVVLNKTPKTKAPQTFTKSEDLNVHYPDNRFDQEKRLLEKTSAAQAFAYANQIDKTTHKSDTAKVGVITAGKSYLDTLSALEELGLGKAELEKLGVRIYKVGMVWPLEPKGITEFSKGLDRILVIEEKRPTLEKQLKEILFDAGLQPSVTGKHDLNGFYQLPIHSELSVGQIARALINHLGIEKSGSIIQSRLQTLEHKELEVKAHTNKALRLPFYCSGCPHNTSTKVPVGSRGLAGIGCHFMVMWMNRNTNVFSQMGGEGVQWLGQAPFTSEKHVFANLGDGTYEHSGILAIRAAVASKVNITYKILYNDAVAMTGGQPVEGGPSVNQIAWQLYGENVSKIVVVSDDIQKYKEPFPPHVSVKHRDAFADVQDHLTTVSGTTVIIYDQTCAAEKRRRRKRGLMIDPPKRVFINDLVCEGCGDCSEQSNCVSIEPKETEFGRKRQINQSTCNKDYSCVKGFCPSFVTIHGGELRKTKVDSAKLESIFKDIPNAKEAPLEKPFNMVITGIGGTGVITIGAILGMAAHTEGKGVTVLDQTGLAQKNGAVASHVKIAKSPNDLNSVRVSTSNTDLLLGCDMVVSASHDILPYLSNVKTNSIINNHMVATAEFTLDTETSMHESAIQKDIQKALNADLTDYVNATELSTKLMGDSIATNMFMLGYALQKGLIPVSIEAVENALRINNVAVNMNIQSLSWGRLMAHNPQKVLDVLKEQEKPVGTIKISQSLKDIIQTRYVFLQSYQNKRYADKYKELIDNVSSLNNDEIKEAVAKNSFKLMAYKDEYEVARLYTDKAFMEKLKHAFTGDFKLEFNLAPPVFIKNKNGKPPKKVAFGAWMMFVFKGLAKLKILRGTKFDIFGYTSERKLERQLIDEYFAMVSYIAQNLNEQNTKLAIDILNVPTHIKGYGHIKQKNFLAAKAKERMLLDAFNHEKKIRNKE